MAVELDLVVANPGQQRSAYTHLKVYRSDTEAGVYAEITRPTTRIAITTEVSYVFRDPTGLDSHWYRYSYFNAKTGAESAQGAAVQGQTDPALEVVSIPELKENYLFGVELSDDSGRPYPNNMFRWYIKAAVSWLEHALDIPLRPLVVTAERVDFYREQFAKFQFFKTKYAPLISVEEVRLTYPTQAEATRIFPAEWIQPNLEAGFIEIVPGSGSLAMPFFGGGGLLLPTIYGGMTRSVPHIMEVDYTAGFARGRVPEAIKHVAAMLAACGPLNIAGDLIAGAGVASYSMGLDGLSQSVSTTASATNAGYGARIIQYQKDIKAMVPELRNYYRGIRIESA